MEMIVQVIANLDIVTWVDAFNQRHGLRDYQEKIMEGISFWGFAVKEPSAQDKNGKV
jgi:hypothetical protein